MDGVYVSIYPRHLDVTNNMKQEDNDVTTFLKSKHIGIFYLLQINFQIFYMAMHLS